MTRSGPSPAITTSSCSGLSSSSYLTRYVFCAFAGCLRVYRRTLVIVPRAPCPVPRKKLTGHGALGTAHLLSQHPSRSRENARGGPIVQREHGSHRSEVNDEASFSSFA